MESFELQGAVWEKIARTRDRAHHLGSSASTLERSREWYRVQACVQKQNLWIRYAARLLFYSKLGFKSPNWSRKADLRIY